MTKAPATAPPLPGALGGIKDSIKGAVLPFLVARLVVVGAVLVARWYGSRSGATSSQRAASHAALLGWDAAWYQRIASLGYGGSGREALRYFPLLPMLARGLKLLPGIDAGAGLLIVANVAAFAALVLVGQVVRNEVVAGRDPRVGFRSQWLLAVFPAGFVLVMGYAESLLLVCALLVFLLTRRGQFVWACAPALLAGLCRPVGLLLAVPIVVEALRGLPATSWAQRVARLLAVAGAPVGTAVYLVWSRFHDGSFTLPFKEQVNSANRGGVADPLATMWHDLNYLVHGQHIGTAAHSFWVVAFVALFAVLVRRWPASYSAYAGVTLIVALSAPNLTSLERYGLGCFPFVLAIATLTGRRWVFWSAVVVSAMMMFGYATLAFVGAYVP